MLARTWSRFSSSMLSVSDSSWLMAKMPRITGRMLSPPDISTEPKVSRCTPEDGSMPTIATSMPNTADMQPLSSEPRLSEAISTSAMQTRAKVSHGPNTTATRAKGGASSTSATQDRAPPTIEAVLPSPSARPG